MPQIGVQRRFFVYDIGDEAGAVVDPRIVETSGEWTYLEGCLSVPDLHWEIIRPARVHLVGIGLDGEEIDVEADELLGRCFQHEVDHLNGKLLFPRLDHTDHKDAMRILRKLPSKTGARGGP